MSKRTNTAIREAILEEVFHDNRLRAGARHARRRRQRVSVRRRRVVAKQLLLLPLCALAFCWPASFPGQPVPEAIAARHEVLFAVRREVADHPPDSYPWAPKPHALGDDMAFKPTPVHYKVSVDETDTVADRRPRSAWFTDYSKLMDRPGLSLAGLLGLDVKTIVIDAGHGGYDPGAIGAAGLKEKTVTLAVAKDLKRRLEALGRYRVLLSRPGDHFVALKQRVKFANAHNADLFISIHVNSLPQKQSAVAETFYFGPTSKRATLRLVRQENRNSHYSLGDFHKMIGRIKNTFKRRESRQLASLIQSHLYRNLNRRNPHLRDAGIHTAPFVVLLGTDMPSVLAEISCISNPGEERKLATARYREQIAGYLEAGIVAYLQKRQPETEPKKGAIQYASAKAVQGQRGATRGDRFRHITFRGGVVQWQAREGGELRRLAQGFRIAENAR